MTIALYVVTDRELSTSWGTYQPGDIITEHQCDEGIGMGASRLMHLRLIAPVGSCEPDEVPAHLHPDTRPVLETDAENQLLDASIEGLDTPERPQPDPSVMPGSEPEDFGKPPAKPKKAAAKKAKAPTAKKPKKAAKKAAKKASKAPAATKKAKADPSVSGDGVGGSGGGEGVASTAAVVPAAELGAEAGEKKS